MKHTAPRPGRESTPSWQASRASELSLPYCDSCRIFVWPARKTCWKCSGALGLKTCRGAGKVVGFSVVHRAVNPELADQVPYAVAVVELDEGVRLFSNLVDCDPSRWRCGARVVAKFEPTSDPDLWVPVFAPE